MTPPTPRPPAPSRTRDFLDHLPLERQSGRQLRRIADGEVVGEWFGCELSSVFQPIVDPATGAVIGNEAFLRVHGRGQRDLSPWMLFSANADDERLIALDRLARTVHALNFIASADDESLLFLNVHGRLLASVGDDHGAAFRRVVDAIGLPPARIVIETPLVASRQADLLSFVLRNYRHNGFRVAVNVESPAQWRRLAAMVPADFVKIDAASLPGDDDAAKALERLREHAGSATVVVKRIEAGTTQPWPHGVLVQGFAWGVPATKPVLQPVLPCDAPNDAAEVGAGERGATRTR